VSEENEILCFSNRRALSLYLSLLLLLKAGTTAGSLLADREEKEERMWTDHCLKAV